MNKLLVIVFCIFSLAAVLALSWFAFPHAAMSKDQLAQLQEPQDPELFEDVELEDFGAVPVMDMMLHYIDNPPVAPEGGAPAKVRFQGC